jgi:S1-C subfamily serine protease
MKRALRFALVFLALVLAVATAVPTALALTRAQRQAIMKSTVLIMPLKMENGKVTNIPWRGSGTIVDAKGLILTNYHVVDETGDWNVLGILVTTRSDQRPEPAFRAEVVAKDPTVDLAVIRIVADAKGNPIDIAKLNLVPVPLGNADDLEIGDDLSVFGYPGIGSDTITLTQGRVSGFVEEEGIDYRRAWIKTDASISGGNSGGAAIDADGKLVGVPTRGSMVDVRPIADTNRDGVIDDKDSSVPTGGFINQLRPINLAFQIIEQARKGGVKPGDKEPTPSGKSSSSLPKGATFSPFTFSSKVDRNNAPTDPSTEFSAGITRLYAFTDYKGMVDGVVYTRTWLVDGETATEKAYSWTYGAKGSLYQYIAYGGDPLPEGKYTLKLTVGGVLVQTGSARIGALKSDPKAPPTPQVKGVTLSGYLLDADTGKGIQGAYVILLKPGVTVRQFAQQQLNEQIAAAGQTDSEGYFRTAPPLARGYTYSVIAAAEGYKTIAEDDALAIEDTDPDETELDPIYMVKQ